jgi:type II secretory pathway component PulF
MNTTEVTDLIALNDQLIALSEAGVPIVVGRESSPRDLSVALERVNASIARRVGRGDSLEQAIESDTSLPAWYRNLIAAGLREGNMESALREFSRVANSADETRFVTESAIFYPLIVTGMAYIGMIVFCLFFVPTLESAYATFRIPPGSGLRVLQIIRDTLPFWVAAPPVLLLIYFVWRGRKRSARAAAEINEGGLLGGVSGTSTAMFEERCAYFAESLASLEEHDVPFDKALTLAAGVCGDPTLADAARALAANVASGKPLGESAAAHRFPPFLRWALFQSEPAVGRKRALRMAAALYRDASVQDIKRAKIVAPIIWLVVLGGSVTLLYGLAVFVPVIQLLKGVATPH